MINITFGLLREPIRIVLFHPGLCVLHIIPAKQHAQNGVRKISTKTGVFYLYLFASDLLYFLIEILLA